MFHGAVFGAGRLEFRDIAALIKKKPWLPHLLTLPPPILLLTDLSVRSKTSVLREVSKGGGSAKVPAVLAHPHKAGKAALLDVADNHLQT